MNMNVAFIGQSVSWGIKFAHAHVPCACKKAFKTCVQKGFQNVRAMCVRAAVIYVCDVRSQFRTFWGKKGPVLDFFS